MNSELFEKVADAIENNPERYDQTTFASPMAGIDIEKWWSSGPGGMAPICDTAFCIAGWAVAIDALEHGVMEISGKNFDVEHASDLLGLEDGEQRNWLFYNGMDAADRTHAHKEVAEWLRAIARGEDLYQTAPEWWDIDL